MNTKPADIVASGTAGIPEGEGLGASPCSLSADEVKLLKDVLWAARSDIWQTLRVNERNLTGIDPVFPHDEPCKPEEPMLIHRAGLDESYEVHRQICEAQKMLASKADSSRSATMNTKPEDLTGANLAALDRELHAEHERVHGSPASTCSADELEAVFIAAIRKQRASEKPPISAARMNDAGWRAVASHVAEFLNQNS